MRSHTAAGSSQLLPYIVTGGGVMVWVPTILTSLRLHEGPLAEEDGGLEAKGASEMHLIEYTLYESKEAMPEMIRSRQQHAHAAARVGERGGGGGGGVGGERRQRGGAEERRRAPSRRARPCDGALSRAARPRLGGRGRCTALHGSSRRLGSGWRQQQTTSTLVCGKGAASSAFRWPRFSLWPRHFWQPARWDPPIEAEWVAHAFVERGGRADAMLRLWRGRLGSPPLQVAQLAWRAFAKIRCAKRPSAAGCRHSKPEPAGAMCERERGPWWIGARHAVSAVGGTDERWSTRLLQTPRG